MVRFHLPRLRSHLFYISTRSILESLSESKLFLAVEFERVQCNIGSHVTLLALGSSTNELLARPIGSPGRCTRTLAAFFFYDQHARNVGNLDPCGVASRSGSTESEWRRGWGWAAANAGGRGDTKVHAVALRAARRWAPSSAAPTMERHAAPFNFLLLTLKKNNFLLSLTLPISSIGLD